MAKRSENNSASLLTLTALAALAAAIAGASLAVLWMGDDVDYGFFINKSIWDSAGSINGVNRFFASQGNHYIFVNGRFVAHVLVQFFCAVAGQPAFAICNAGVWCLFVCLACRACGVRRPLQNPAAAVTISALSVLVFVTKMMPSTQIGFVWMFALNLWFVSLYLPSLKKCNAKRTVLLCILAIIAGNGQEALSIGLCAAFAVMIVKKRHHICRPARAIAACYALGTAINCLSPGTLNRAHSTDIATTTSAVYALFSLRAVYLLAAVIVWRRLAHGSSLKTIYRNNALYLNAMLVLLAFNAAIGVYSNRQLFGAELMALIAAVRLLPRHTFGKAANTVLAACAMAMMVWQTALAVDVRRQYRQIEDLVRKKGGGVVYFDRKRVSDNIIAQEFHYYEDLVGTGYADTHHSLQKLLKKNTGVKRNAIIWPTYVGRRKHNRDTVVNYAPGHFFIVANDSITPRVTLHGRALANTTAQSDTLVFGRPAVRGTGWNGYLVVPSRPFGRVDSITLSYP